MHGTDPEIVDKMELLASRFQAVGGLASNDLIRDQTKGFGQDEGISTCGTGCSRGDENLPGHHRGIKKIACLGSGFVGGVYSITDYFSSISS